MMDQLNPATGRLVIRFGTILVLLTGIIFIVGGDPEAHANLGGNDFYSPNSPPPGEHSLEDFIASYWNWWNSQPAATASNWPQCIKGDGGTIGTNQSVVFVGNPAFASEKNANATQQKCEISSNQLLYLTVYPGEAATGTKPDTGEYPNIKDSNELLKLAQDSNREMKLMQVKVDGQDVSPFIVQQHTSQPFKFIVPKENAFEWGEGIVGENMSSIAENYYLFFKPLPVGEHTIDLKVIRDPLEAGAPVENNKANWNIRVIP
jgi:hypothetical protein